MECNSIFLLSSAKDHPARLNGNHVRHREDGIVTCSEFFSSISLEAEKTCQGELHFTCYQQKICGAVEEGGKASW